jgi:hypothetical protein
MQSESTPYALNGTYLGLAATCKNNEMKILNIDPSAEYLTYGHTHYIVVLFHQITHLFTVLNFHFTANKENLLAVANPGKAFV